MIWNEFSDVAPELAERAEALIERVGVVLVGTVRRDGSPRISPVEPLLTAGELYLGMMPRSLKAIDLRRDPRATVHSAVVDRQASDGEFKLHGRVRRVTDDEEKARYCRALEAKIGWAPEGMGFELFAVTVESAALFESEDEDDKRVVTRFRRDSGVDRFRQGLEGGDE